MYGAMQGAVWYYMGLDSHMSKIGFGSTGNGGKTLDTHFKYDGTDYTGSNLVSAKKNGASWSGLYYAVAHMPKNYKGACSVCVRGESEQSAVLKFVPQNVPPTSVGATVRK